MILLMGGEPLSLQSLRGGPRVPPFMSISPLNAQDTAYLITAFDDHNQRCDKNSRKDQSTDIHRGLFC